MHLANNAVQKYGPQFDKDPLFDHNIWHVDQLAEWFSKEEGFKGKDFADVRSDATDVRNARREQKLKKKKSSRLPDQS
jgi:hypothetical protein